MSQSFGALLTSLRESKGWTQEKLAVKIRVSRGYLGKLEAGLSDPRWQTVQALADALGVRTDELRTRA